MGIDFRIDDGFVLWVLLCCWGLGNLVIIFVMLDVVGEVMNVLYIGYLNMRVMSVE